MLITARATGTIVEAELRPPTGRSLYAGDLHRPSGDDSYGVALYGSSDQGVGIGLSLDILARAMDPPRKLQYARITLPPAAAGQYRRTWQGWQLFLSFSDGPALTLPPPPPDP